MSDFFLFDGGMYKQCNGDDGRIRVPLKSGLESQTLMIDPELQADAQSSLGGNIHMNKFADIFNNLAVGDCVYIHLVPDMMGVRGFYAGPQDPVAGFTADFDLVNIQDIDAAIDAGALGSTVDGTVPAINVDFSNGVGDAAYDAYAKACQNGGAFTDYRNPDAVTFEYYEKPVALKLGQAQYVRMCVTALPGETDPDPCGDCTTCGSGRGWPELQYGVIVDRTCFAKNLVRSYCNCNDPICAGCNKCESGPVYKHEGAG